ncbi:tRNA-splicing endonuclease subunit Sen34 [Neocloeon triangulifer]|uniref:tRNA-splicing endonuclease subunit Sen34 n=1 Tax=Neocloeon triangulifer TaxID=2078957 RepID=UPI00286F0388|nr:tRNA-splicing endonuclease subunit Sen34 [Neocloeon triangulifer]
MISLVALDGEAHVWSADDWLTLRRDHRICGQLTGILAGVSHQTKHNGLPLALLPEETRLLLQEKIARLVDYEALRQKPSGDLKAKFEEYQKHCYQEQVKSHEEERKKKVTEMVDIIVEGKRRKLMGLSTKKAKRRKLDNSSSAEASSSYAEEFELPDRDSIIKEELSKIVPIPEDSALATIPTECPWLDTMTPTEIPYPLPSRRIEWLKTKTFADLWKRGYFITAGQKFGGDFLVYPGDPLKFHAQYIVTCRLPEESIPALELIALCRVGTSVKKAVILATFDTDDGNSEEEETVTYQTLNWVT